MALRRLLPDLTPFRHNRTLRLVVGSTFISSLGSQAALVALPYQIYVETRSALLVGLLGAVELGPIVTMSLYGGVLADTFDRRRLLQLAQIGVAACTGGLALAAVIGHPPLVVLYGLGGLVAGFNAVQDTATAAMLPRLISNPDLIGPALAANYGLDTLAQVVGPGLGGVLIATLGVQGAYGIDALSCLAVVVAVFSIAPHPGAQSRTTTREPTLRSIREGVRFVCSKKALLGSFAIDLVAMTFGMPRALFAVLAVSVYHAGAQGTGFLYAAVALGATVAALFTGWIGQARRLGLITIWAVVIWGLMIATAGLMHTIWLAAAFLALAGAADSVSAVCRTIINQELTPEKYRGRMASIFGIVVAGGPRLGDIESGTVATAAGVEFSVVSGGLLCLAGVAAILFAFPQLARYGASTEGEDAGAGDSPDDGDCNGHPEP
jgi:MFS family permease